MTYRAVGSASVTSPGFTATLRLAAVLAEAGHHTDHVGDRVLIAPSHETGFGR